MRPIRKGRIARIGLLSILGLAGLSRPSHGQVWYAIPAPTIDVARYTSIFECLAAVQRVDESDLGHLVTRDTFAVGSTGSVAPPSARASETARQCGIRGVGRDVPLAEVEQWLAFFLAAGRDTDVVTLAHRWLATPEDAGANAKVRATKLHQLAGMYLKATPARLDLAVPVVAELQSPSLSATWDQRIDAAWQLFQTALVVPDTSRARQAAAWVADLGDRLASTLSAERPYDGPSSHFVEAHQYLTESVALDSLRIGLSSYTALQQSITDRLKLPRSRIGTSAPPVVGNFWFPYPATSSARDRQREPRIAPQPGHITLVVSGINDELGTAMVWNIAATLWRLHRRFPTLDIILTAHTRGSFADTAPPSPTDEAALERRLYQDFYQIPATLAVETTDFWRLPDPDRRRINRETQNEARYGGGMTLIDANGVIVDESWFDKRTEDHFSGLIGVLVSQR